MLTKSTQWLMWTKSTDFVWSDTGMSKTELSALPAGEPAAIHGSVQFDLASAITGRTYRIFIFKPEVEAPPGGYPLVLAVDGNMVFPIMATVDATFELTGKAAIVVGVGYPTSDYLELMRLRTRDLTPPTPIDRIPQRPNGKHVAADLLSFFYGSSEGEDFLYGVAIRRDDCRGLADSAQRPARLT